MTIRTWTYFGSTVRIGPAPGSRFGVLEVVNLGPLSMEIYCHFRPIVLEAICGAPAVVARLDRAIDVLVEPPPVNPGVYNATGSPPQAVVVREASHDLWAMHARAMARHGFIRAVFLPHEAQAAYRFAEVAAGHAGRGSRRLDYADSGPAPL